MTQGITCYHPRSEKFKKGLMQWDFPMESASFRRTLAHCALQGAQKTFLLMFTPTTVCFDVIGDVSANRETFEARGQHDFVPGMGKCTPKSHVYGRFYENEEQ